MMHWRIFSIVLFFSSSAFAITDQERAELKRLHDELQSLRIIVDTAERSSEKAHRQQINYQQLRKDIEAILHGLDDAVNSKRREPRELQPIEGDYL